MKIGIDLGTCNSLVFRPQKGIVLKEPSVVAVDIENNSILAVGKRAKQMVGRTPDSISVYRPLKDGVIADYRVTESMLRYFIKKSLGFLRFFKPDVMIGVPVGITSTEKRAVIEAGKNAGAKAVFLAPEPILAAIGAGVPIESCSGNMVVDVGGGTMEAAVISLGGIVNFRSLRLAGDKMDFAILDYIKKKYNLAIGSQTAEKIKKTIGTAVAEKKEKKMNIRGRDITSGLPRNIEISSNDTAEALIGVLNEIVQVVKSTLRDTPPELSADIMNKGIVMTGGASRLNNFQKLITDRTGVPAILAEDSILCVVKGTGEMLKNLEIYKRAIMSK